MSLISLLFKFTGDRTPLKQEAEKAKADMSKAGSEIGKEFASQMKGQIMAAIGIGAIVGQFKKTVDEIKQAARESRTSGLAPTAEMALRRAEEDTGLPREEIMAMARKEPAKFEAFIKPYEPAITDAQIAEAERIRSATKMAANRVTENAIAAAVSPGYGAESMGAVQGLNIAPGPRLQFAQPRITNPTQDFVDLVVVARQQAEIAKAQLEEARKLRDTVERQ